MAAQNSHLATSADRVIYLDHAATTPVHPDVMQAMIPFFTQRFGNPSSVHRLGRAGKQGLEGARREVAAVLGCRPGEIVFTGSGSEADNLAIKGVAFAHRAAGNATSHIITSPIEHHAVSHTVEYLEHQGFDVTTLPVDSFGRVAPADLEAAMRPDTCLVTIMYANNEIGTIEPIAELAAITHRHGALFHTDAVQAGGSLDLKVSELGVDLLSLSGHKFYGPKGVGVLYVKTGVKLMPQTQGGSQEQQRRAGTENTAGIAGFAAALTRAYAERDQEQPYVQGLRDQLIAGIQQRIPNAFLQGHPTERLPNSAAFCFAGVTGEDLLLRLDLAGICASSGSACTSGSTEPSHVLLAIGTDPNLAIGSLRLTTGVDNTPEDIAYTLDTLAKIVSDLRAANPVLAQEPALVL